MDYDYLPGLSRRKTARDRDPLPELLEEWLGKAAAAKEIESRLLDPVPISEGVDEALRKLLPPELATLQKIKEAWLDIAGEALADFLSPVSMEKTTLLVEVSHPAYMMTFGEGEKSLLLSKIEGVVGSGKCSAIRLVPVGGAPRRGRFGKKRTDDD